MFFNSFLRVPCPSRVTGQTRVSHLIHVSKGIPIPINPNVVILKDNTATKSSDTQPVALFGDEGIYCFTESLTEFLSRSSTENSSFNWSEIEEMYGDGEIKKKKKTYKKKIPLLFILHMSYKILEVLFVLQMN